MLLLSASFSIVEISSYFRKFSELLDNCHFHFLKLNGDLESYKLESSILPALQNYNPFSIQTSSNILQRHFRHNATSKNTCLIHIYLYTEIDPLIVSTYQVYSDLLVYIDSMSEFWPNHAIFIGILKSTASPEERDMRVAVFGQDLPFKPIGGAILFIDFERSSLNRICLPCFIDATSIFNPVKLSLLEELQDLQSLSSPLNSNLRGGFAIQGIDTQVHPEASCTLLSQMPSYRVFKQKQPHYESCVMHALKSKFNCTIPDLVTSEHLPKMILLMTLTNPVTQNIVINKEQNYLVWNSYLTYFDHLMLSAYQQRPKMSARVITKPYSFEIWTLLIASTIMLSLLTVAVERIQHVHVKLSPIALDMLSSILDQPMSRNIQRVIGNRERSLLPVWLRIWMLMAICICSAYEAIIYSNIAHGIPPEWPANLEEYLADTGYLKLTLSAFIATMKDPHRNFSSTVHHFVSESLRTTKKEAPLLRKVLENVKFALFSETWKRLQHLSQDVRENGVTSQPSFKGLVMIDFANLNGLQFKLMFDAVYSHAVVSTKIDNVLGISLPGLWWVTRNFFHDRLSKGLGELEQSGFPDYFWHRVWDFGSCDKIRDMLQNHPITPSSVIFKRCRYILNMGTTMDIAERIPKPLHLKQLKSIFLPSASNNAGYNFSFGNFQQKSVFKVEKLR